MNKKHKSVKVALYSLGCKLNQASYHSTDATLKGGLITGGRSLESKDLELHIIVLCWVIPPMYCDFL